MLQFLGTLNTFVVTYTPKVRGRQSLIVKVDGREITGSPFQVFVKIHPTLLGKSVRVIDQLNKPWDIAVTHNQQLIVTEAGRKKVTVMERDGTRVQTIECEHFRKPTGVATGPDGAIYVSDVDAKCLFKFSKDGKLLYQTAQVFAYPLFVKIIHDKVYVSDKSLRKVNIFDLDCNAEGFIDTGAFLEPKGIAEYGNKLYVGSVEGRVDVYQCLPGGKHIHQVSIDECKASRGLAFDKSGYLYVVFYEGGPQGVYVFDTDGKYVTSFGLKKSGFMEGPAGIAIDEDGFVYACDKAGKVFVF